MLAPCSGCQRHIKASPCPFCGTREVASRRDSVGWSRAQRLASAVLVSTTALACSKGSDGAQPAIPAPDPSAVQPEPTVAALYGAPPADEIPSAPDASPSPRMSAEAPSSAYGAPPAQLDSKKKPERQQAPAYGGPPPNVKP